MLTVQEARVKGINACIEALGKDFVESHKESSSAGWGALPGSVRCVVCVDADPSQNTELALDSTSRWTRYAECRVQLQDGAITHIYCGEDKRKS